MTVDLRPSLGDPSLDVMGFLNEVVQRFPRAISFAPGRPLGNLFDVRGALGEIDEFVKHRATTTGVTPEECLTALGQYGNTAGIVQELLARHLLLDADIHVEPDAVLVTTGCQEAMTIVMMGLFDPAVDTLLVSDPSYIGITGLAQLMNIPVHPIPTGDEGLLPTAVEAAIHAVRRSGRRPRALYDVPDFNNPLGTSIPVPARRELLALAERHGMLVIEDNPYGAFAYDGDPLPTLKSLDRGATVIYLGSFSKTLFPGLRIGYLVADQVVDGSGHTLAATLAKVKSLTTVNTSPLTQAIVGGMLLRFGGSLAGLMKEKLPAYRANRDRMLRALDTRLGAGAKDIGVRWNRPGGGFFIAMDLPFPFGTEELDCCARDFGVIVCPMSFFARLPGRESSVRLSFSAVSQPAIDTGIERFAAFIRYEVERRTASGTVSSHRVGTHS